MTIHDKQVHLDASNLRFNVFSAKEIEQLSVCKITSSVSFDSIGNSVTGGLYDVAMGPSSKNDICSTCSNDINSCIGHFGHIQLTMPVFNPFFIKTVHDILSITCLKCFRLQISDHIKSIVKLQLQLVDAGYIIEAQALEVLKSEEFADASGEKVKSEAGDLVHVRVAEYYNLLKNYPLNQYNVTKNTRAIRNAILNSTIKGIMVKICKFCKQPVRRVKYTYKRLVYSISKKEMEEMQKSNDMDEEAIKATNKTIFADECRHYFKQLFRIDGDFLRLLMPVLGNTTDDGFNIFFMDIVPVVPPNVRPANRMRDGLIEHPQTKTYYNVISANNQLRYILAHDKGDKESNFSEKFLLDSENIYKLAQGDTTEEKIYYKWQELQTFVDQTLDISIGNSQKAEGFGLKQIIEKKEGLIRMHMMGKRVNFAARTVITPDPNINIDQIGIPEAFALKLTYPVPVTDWNVSELRKMVSNGPKVHPGACFIEEENGFKRRIPDDSQKREALANTLLTPNENRGVKIVHRHLINGDVLLLNRQPSLHRPSIMAHKARILKGEKTFRMHYSNCKSYNADFDGDEMNAHFPQTELGRSEAYNLVNVANNYLVPKDGTPLGGLIQDHMISGAKLALRGRFFNKEDYQQLVFQGLSHCKGDLILMPPAILKPKQLWSGKQILTTLIVNLTPKGMPGINLSGQAKISANSWQSQKPREWLAGGSPFKQNEMTESEVVIRNGELLSGILDKNHYGATPFSLVHCMYELYGGEVSTQLLTSLAKVFTIFLQWEGFTLGVHDILVLDHADKKREKIVEESRKAGRDATAQALELENPTDAELAQKLEEAYVKNPKFRVILDRKYKSVMDGFTNDINKTCLPAGLLCKFPSNNLQLMVMSGAKGSTVNTMQISCLLGQIELEGKRPPLMISGKSLPSFPAWEMSPKSGGFIDGRFMTGIQPQDFFFHCMAGREGLIDTAVKTSRSGYLQRCLVKHLEGLTVNYDMTVRDSDNSIVQFMYGEDGMDISKSQFLKQNQLAFLQSNHSAIVNEDALQQLYNTAEMDEELRKHNKKLRVWKKRNGTALFKQRLSGFVHFSNEQQHLMKIKNPSKLKKSSGRTKLTSQLVKDWHKVSPEARAVYQKLNRKCPDPTLSTFMPHSYLGSISEYVEQLLDSYGSKSKSSEIKDLLYIKSIRALADAGEPVGLLAAQSIGEPSTQMTLNTFHFAGRGDMNVTLGIPRLREILMMASSNIKTPSMEIPFQNQKSRKLPKTAEKFRVRLNRVTVADVLESINVKSSLVVRPKRSRQFELTFKFLPNDAYKQEFSVKPKKIIQHMHQKFFNVMFKFIKKAALEKLSYVEKDDEKKQKKTAGNEDAEIDSKPAESGGGKNDGDSSDDEPLGDDADATDARKKNRQMDEQEYEEPEQNTAEADATRMSDESEDENDEEFDPRKVKREIIIDENADEEQLENIEMKEALASELADQNTILQVIAKKNNMALDYQHDSENFLWCQLKFELPLKYKNIDLTNSLREASKASVIWEVSKLKRAITFKQADQLLLKTDGINIHAMFEFDKILDLNRLYTNDIHAVARTYGIEAAGRVIVKEVQNVFKVYGITVDPRHLLLIADYMTSDGTFQPMSRRGMESSASPLQQLSFESALQFLKVATVQGRRDNIDSPSSCLMMGIPCKSGTGAFTLVNDLIGLKKQRNGL